MGALVSLCQILQSALAQRITTHSGRTQAFAEGAAARASNTAPRASFNSFIIHLRSGPRFPLFVVASGRLVQCRMDGRHRGRSGRLLVPDATGPLEGAAAQIVAVERRERMRSKQPCFHRRTPGLPPSMMQEGGCRLASASTDEREGRSANLI